MSIWHGRGGIYLNKRLECSICLSNGIKCVETSVARDHVINRVIFHYWLWNTATIFLKKQVFQLDELFAQWVHSCQPQTEAITISYYI